MRNLARCVLTGSAPGIHVPVHRNTFTPTLSAVQRPPFLPPSRPTRLFLLHPDEPPVSDPSPPTSHVQRSADFYTRHSPSYELCPTLPVWSVSCVNHRRPFFLLSFERLFHDLLVSPLSPFRCTKGRAPPLFLGPPTTCKLHTVLPSYFVTSRGPLISRAI